MKTAQARTSAGALRTLALGSALSLAAIAATLSISATADAARPLIARDMCNQTSGNPMGYQCPTADHLLVRPKYSDGTCGSWICCPPNGDGTYDCTRATNPTRAQINNRLQSVTGARPTTADPGPAPSGGKAPAAQGGRLTTNPN